MAERADRLANNAMLLRRSGFEVRRLANRIYGRNRRDVATAVDLKLADNEVACLR